MTTPGITTVIVSRGMEPLLHVCLRALRAALAPRPAAAQDVIVVVDNASPTPYTPAFLAQHGVQGVRSDEHLSFGRACNLGFARFPNDRVLLLNNDLLLEPDAIVAMARVLDAQPDVGICGLRLLFPDGTLQHAGVVFGKDKVGPYHWQRRVPAEAVSRENRAFQAVTGACMLVRGELWQALGGLDASYPFGLEDIDFCLRTRPRGVRVVCCHEAHGLHFESMTPGRVELDKPSRKLFMQRWKGRYAIDG